MREFCSGGGGGGGEDGGWGVCVFNCGIRGCRS